MYTILKSVESIIERCKETKDRIISSWAYNHPQLIVILTLLTVIMWQNFSHLLPTIDINPAYYTSGVGNTSERSAEVCDYHCLTSEWVELRTEEIMREDSESFRLQSRYKALTEANEMITTI